MPATVAVVVGRSHPGTGIRQRRAGHEHHHRVAHAIFQAQLDRRSARGHDKLVGFALAALDRVQPRQRIAAKIAQVHHGYVTDARDGECAAAGSDAGGRGRIDPLADDGKMVVTADDVGLAGFRQHQVMLIARLLHECTVERAALATGIDVRHPVAQHEQHRLAGG